MCLVAGAAFSLTGAPSNLPGAPSRIALPEPAAERATPALPPLEAAPVARDPIHPRPPGDTPRIEAAPLVSELPGTRDIRAQAVARELRQLQRAANPSGSGRYGATARSAQAAWLLGLIHLHGAGVRRDPSSAQLWFQRAASNGREPWADAGLAWCAIDGCVGPAQPLVADRSIAQLRASHAARADYLGWLLAQRQTPLQVGPPGPDGMEAPRPGMGLLQRAAADGDVQALTELGMLAVGRGQLEQAVGYFRRAAPHSDAAAYNLREVQARLADQALKPERVPPSPSASEALEAARRYHRGVGVPMNYAEAIRLYRLAETRGSLEARRMLQLIYAQPDPLGGINLAWMRQLAFVDTASSLPVVGTVLNAHTLQREATPLFDLMPRFWRDQLTQVGR
ncbi:tetratricopeptide repeat protein [Ottowia flava]